MQDNQEIDSKNSSNVDLSFVPPKLWFTLKEACLLKGLNYKTACNKPSLKPNKGKCDAWVGGNKVFSRGTIMAWLLLTDDQIEN
jgi:hypothetical protein